MFFMYKDITFFFNNLKLTFLMMYKKMCFLLFALIHTFEWFKHFKNSEVYLSEI